MTNRKNWLGMFVIVFCIFGLTITGCLIAKVSIIYDESVPLEQTSQIYIYGVGTVTGYNGMPVNWPNNNVVQIPSGNTLLELNVNARFWINSWLRADGVLFQYNFQPGKKYLFEADMEKGQYGFDVYAWNFGETIGTFDNKHYVEFVPFPRQRTILN